MNFARRFRAHILTKKRPVPPGLCIKDMTFNGVPVRVYEPTATSGEKKRGLVFFHGGGWVFGSIGKMGTHVHNIQFPIENDATLICKNVLFFHR